VPGLGRTMCFDLKKVFCQGGTMPPYAIGSVRVDPRVWWTVMGGMRGYGWVFFNRMFVPPYILVR